MAVQERTRYRISGSLFLIALVVIIVPMFFDGETTSIEPIPPAPQVQPMRQLPAYEDVVPSSDVVARVQALSDEVDEDGFSTSTKERFGEPILLTSSSETEVWAVQAASFAKVENARNFRQRLRDAGLEAFVSSAKNSSGTIMHRVAVGPLLKHADAKTLQDKISQEFDVSPQIVEMIP